MRAALNLRDWLTIAAALATIAASWVAARYAGRSSVKVAEISADEGAFVRAEGIYKNAIAQLERELEAQRRRFEEQLAEQRGRSERQLADQQERFDELLDEQRTRFQREQHALLAKIAELEAADSGVAG